jgi:diguanylate cyclase (GGDEF)-like protein
VSLSDVKRLFFSVRSRVGVFALLATLIPSATLGWLAYQRNAEVLRQKAAHEVENAAAVATREIGLWLNDRIEEMRIFGSSYLITENLERLASLSANPANQEIRSQLRTRTRDYLASVASRFPGFSELRVVAPGREVLSGASAIPAGMLPADWASRVTGGRVVIGEPRWNPREQTVTIGIAVPVRSGRGDTVGALVATIDARAVGAILDRVPLADGDIYLVGSSGRRLFGSTNAAPPVPDELTTLHSSTERSSLREYVNDRGKRVVGAFKPLPGHDWGVNAELDHAIVFAQVDELQNTTLKIVLLLLVGVGVGAWWIGLTIVRPLDQLIAAANRVASGDLDITLPVRRSDELGHLTERFNEMTAQLQRNREALADAHDELLRKNIELEAISITDALTSLYNRRYLMQVLDRQFQLFARTSRPFTLLMIDLDHFKRINDSHGHPAGDAVLVKAARVLRDSIRAADYAARIGGEEFVILLTDTGADEALPSAERIRAMIAATEVEWEGQKIRCTASIGLSEVEGAGDTPSALFARADAALYEAKHQGRDRVCQRSAKVRLVHSGTAGAA